MSYAYSRNTGASSLPSYTSNSKSPKISDHSWDGLPGLAKQWIMEGAAAFHTARPRDIHTALSFAVHIFKRVFTVANAVILLWMFTLWRGERTVFQESINACLWENWEKWPQGTVPHHVAFIADPQLVDPHTYPGRPWPLSTLTVKYTDQYLRRSFSFMQDKLVPDSVLFLGDLFDGGREWATSTSSSPEDRYKGITDSFWKKEYGRFMKIFLDPWMEQNEPPVDGRGRRLIASLPGNHDLGFAKGIQEPVRDRFHAYFGHGNRVDVIGNHTFVSVDTVSLSAMDQPDPQTGSSSSSSSSDNEAIWKGTNDFLNKMSTHRAKAEMDELRMLKNISEGIQFDYRIVDAVDPSIHSTDQNNPINLPTILLTHVPLYRKPATPCGPLREKYPPSSTTEELEEDEPNSLKIAGGYQYQNVLTPTISNELVSKAGPNVVQIYSGDDHDYCELIHREFNGSPNEITVKSLSWAMGVRHPGFLMTSLWNPIDPETGQPIQKSSSPTIQNHLCILPDQLGIFIHYACILGLSIVVLFFNSVYYAFFAPTPSTSLNDSILPLSERRGDPYRHQYHTSGTSSSTLSTSGGLASRSGLTAFPRYPGAKAPQDAYHALEQDDMGTPNSKDKGLYRPARAHGFRQKSVLMTREFMRSVRLVAKIVLPVYFFLIWRW